LCCGRTESELRVWLRDVAARVTYWCTSDGGSCKALYDIRTALGLTVAELALRAALTDDDIERIEEGGTEPTIPVLRRLAAALNADVRLTGGHDLGSVVRNPRRLNHAVGTQTQLLYAPEPPLCASPAHSAFVSSRIQNRPFCSESIAAAR
jgi:transcriptional regulator with XRE-family HTH domain